MLKVLGFLVEMKVNKLNLDNKIRQVHVHKMIYNKLQNLSDLKCILIRVDWNKRLGMGHLSRCFELAKKLKKLKITPYFFLKYDKNTIERYIFL